MRERKLLSVVFLSAIIGVSAVLLDVAFPLPPIKPYSLVIYDKHGEVLQIFLAADGIWRIRTHPEEIPEKLKQILIEREDHFFYRHPGVNPLAVMRAVVQNIFTGKRVSGASTVTMQVARMLEPKERTYWNKCLEMARALQLEMHYSKNEILELYLSMIPLGGNIEGLKSASLLYYQTPPERLNIAQLFDLILIPSDPNDLRPDRNGERLLSERKKRSEHWIETGAFSKQDSIILWQTGAGARRSESPRLAPHYCIRVKDQAAGLDEVTASIDLKMQRNVEGLLSRHLTAWKQVGVLNGAAIVLENRTGSVLAYVGSEDFKDVRSHGQVDAVRALRSPGSTLKPLLYALQVERGTLTPKTRLLDTPYDAEGFYAENYDGMYSGLVYADEALRRSLNVPMVHLLKKTGVEAFVSFVADAGIVSLEAQKENLGLSVILGGCGVTLEELATAYSAFPRGGTYLRPRFIAARTEQLTHSARPGQSPKVIFSPSTAYMVTEILSSLNRPDVPNNFESSLNLPKVAFKTGTSYGRRDGWSIGYSGEYTVGVWIGNVNHKGSPRLTGGTAAAPLLIDIFNAISTPNQKSILGRPDDVLDRDVCANTGLTPTPLCRHTITDMYSVGHTLERFCELDKEFLLSPDGKAQYCPSCVGSHRYAVASFQDYPGELLKFWDQAGIAYRKMPQHNLQCTRVFAGTGPKITSPADATTYYVVSSAYQFAFQASSTLDVKEQSWYIDEQFVSRREVGRTLFLPLKAGDHTISCVDDRGRSSSVRITVKSML